MTKKRALKWLGSIILFLFLYVVLGALLPFANTKQVDEMFARAFTPEKFYGSSDTSVDRAAIVETSTDALTKRMQMIHQAKERIVLSTFDIRDGTSVNDIFSALWEAAERGVSVKILVDGMYGALHMSENPLYYAISQSPNVEIRFYNIPNPLKPWTINGRMHDKYLLVDNQYLILGGRNTFDYFLGEYNLKKLSYDRDVFIWNTAAEDGEQSSVLFQVNDYFQTIWDSGYCKPVFSKSPGHLKKEIEVSRETLRKHYQDAVTKVPDFALDAPDFYSATLPIQKATLISNPIQPLGKEPYIWYQLNQLMQRAEKRVYIHTPYAVFSKDMYRDASNIKVPQFTMLVNSTAVGDNFMASSDYTRNRSKILETGITLYEYFGDLSSHGKSVLIDHDLSLIGSYNVDMRSTYVNTEVMLVIHGEEFNKELERNILAMEQEALKVNSDGTYEPNPNVNYQELTQTKKFLFSITSRLFQLFRYLI